MEHISLELQTLTQITEKLTKELEEQRKEIANFRQYHAEQREDCRKTLFDVIHLMEIKQTDFLARQNGVKDSILNIRNALEKFKEEHRQLHKEMNNKAWSIMEKLLLGSLGGFVTYLITYLASRGGL